MISARLLTVERSRRRFHGQRPWASRKPTAKEFPRISRYPSNDGVFYRDQVGPYPGEESVPNCPERPREGRLQAVRPAILGCQRMLIMTADIPTSRWRSG